VWRRNADRSAQRFEADCYSERRCDSLAPNNNQIGTGAKGGVIVKKRTVALLAAICAVGVAAPASAQYPDRPIKMIVPWAAGGDTDNIFRPLAPLLQKHLGQAVVIANVGGASGTVGAREAKGSPADGYTVYAVHDYIHLVHYAGLTDITYKDFEPICLVAATPSVLTASPKTPWTDWKGLVEDAKKRPGEISVGATLGSTSHIFPASVEKAAGIKFKYVSYDGLAPRMNAILGGHIDLTDSNLTQKGKVEAGQLKFIAIASEQRNADMPNVPTLKELGMNIVYEVVRGLMVPKGTPAPVRAKLAEACQKTTSEAEFQDAMKKQGTRVAFLDDKAYAAFLDKIDAENKAIMTDLGLIKK
jgi:tripartite-type tricarboxylate transporter receptor subunit TctC